MSEVVKWPHILPLLNILHGITNLSSAIANFLNLPNLICKLRKTNQQSRETQNLETPPMALSWNEIKDRALNFSKEWADTSNEDADAKPFLVEFFNLFGISNSRESIAKLFCGLIMSI